ncbi:MAG: TolC family protein [Spirochaetales bacterium]|jgi:outer membrane protein TolC|nr:TolC family protein [Spirochaetales bacterium]
MKRSVKKILFLCALVCAGGFAAAEDYSLEGYLEQVEKYSKDLSLSRKNVEQAELVVRQAWAAVLPTIFAQVGYKRNLLDIKQPQPIGASTTAMGGIYPLALQKMDVNKDNEVTLALGLNQVIFNKKAFAGLKYGKEYQNISGIAYDETKSVILTAAKKAYFGALLLQNVLTVREDAQENDRAVWENMKKRYEAGLAQELEMLRAEVTWQSRTPEVTQARRDLKIALLQLKNLAGIDINEEIVLTTPLAEFPALPGEVDIEECLARRGDYTLLLRQKRLTEISAEVAAADHYPTVSASLNLARTGSGDKAKLMESPINSLQLGVTIGLPIFSGGAVSSQVQSEKIDIAKQDTEIAKKREDIQTEITQLELSLREAWQRIETSQKTQETAQRAYNLARLSLENGLITQLELNDSAVQLEQVQLGYYSAVYDYLSRYFDWEKALGL